MENKELINLLETLPVPQQASTAHQRKLRVALMNSKVFRKTNSMFSLRKFVLALALLLVLVGGAWFIQQDNLRQKQLAKNPPDTKNSNFSQENKKLAVALQENWQVVTWHDPANTVLGYKFDIPDSWRELENSDYGSERQIEVTSCFKTVPDCVGSSFSVQVLSSFNPPDANNNSLPPNWTKTYINIDGVSATRIDMPANGISTLYGIEIYFKKDNSWYLLQAYYPKAAKAESEIIFEHLFSTFAFMVPEPPTAPAEYGLLKDVEKWVSTYQIKDPSGLVCSDGNKGNINIPYAFQMATSGDTVNFTQPGDIDSPYAKVIATLKNNGWQQCKTIGETELQDTKSTSEVFIKNGKLIGVYKYYSMGAGNSLSVLIQYNSK